MAKIHPTKWNGAEKFAAIFPALGTMIPVRQRSVLAKRLSAAEVTNMNNDVALAVKRAADAAGVDPVNIEDWVDRFTYLGKPGLLAEAEMAAAACAENIAGTWELSSRLSGGELTNARGNLYYDMDPKNLRGWHMITMWTEENHFETDSKETFVLAALAELTFEQESPHSVIGRSKGRIVGNFGEYERGKDIEDEFRLVRVGNNEKMVGVSRRYSYAEDGGTSLSGNAGEQFFSHMLVGVGGDPNAIVFANSGLPALGNRGRTVDVVDTYVNVSHDRPLIGGWEPIKDYFARITDPKSSLDMFRKSGKSGSALHYFQGAPPASRLREYSPLEKVLHSMGERA